MSSFDLFLILYGILVIVIMTYIAYIGDKYDSKK